MSSVFPRKGAANVRPADAKRSLLKAPTPTWNPCEALAALLASGSVLREDAIRSVMAKAAFLTRDDVARSAFALGWISRRDLGALARETIVATIERKLRESCGLAPKIAAHFASLGSDERRPSSEEGPKKG
jgi:hypothetical protein